MISGDFTYDYLKLTTSGLEENYTYYSEFIKTNSSNGYEAWNTLEEMHSSLNDSFWS